MTTSVTTPRALLTFRMLLAVALTLALGPRASLAIHEGQEASLQNHVLYLQSVSDKIDYYSDCDDGCWSGKNDADNVTKNYRKKTVHIVNLSGQDISTGSIWKDLGYNEIDDGWGAPDDGWWFFGDEFWGSRTDYRYNTYEDTYYVFPDTGVWFSQVDIEAGGMATYAERVDSLFFEYSDTRCERSRGGGDCEGEDIYTGFNAFSIASNIWSVGYTCENGYTGRFDWLEEGGWGANAMFEVGTGPNDVEAYIVLPPEACEDESNVYLVEVDDEWLDRDTLDRDTTGADGDWETLDAHTADNGSIPDFLVGFEPAYVEMRRSSNGADVANTGDDFTLLTQLGGVVFDDSSNPANGNYEIRFHYGWTPWKDRDNPGGTGDRESHYHYTAWNDPGATFGGRMPQRDPKRVECRAKQYPGVVFTDESPTNADGYIEGDLGDGHVRAFVCSTEVGYECVSSVSTGYGYRTCDLDVEARYYFGLEPICAGNILDGTDNGWCDASSGEAKIVARWDPDLCLNAVGNNSTDNATWVNTYECGAVVERWRFNLETGKIHAAWDSSLCLNAVGNSDAEAGADVNLYACDSVSETWIYDESSGEIQAGWDSSLCLNVVGNQSSSSSNVNVWTCSGVLETWSVEYE